VLVSFDAPALERDEVRPAPAGQEGARVLVSSGRPRPGLSVRIVEPQARTPCPPGRVGEVWVAGPSVAQGYWEQPEVNERTFRARLEGEDQTPFLRTGDLGFLQDGELFITGRLKDLIIIRGRNLYPQDVERTVGQAHPALRAEAGASFAVE